MAAAAVSPAGAAVFRAADARPAVFPAEATAADEAAAVISAAAGRAAGAHPRLPRAVPTATAPSSSTTRAVTTAAAETGRRFCCGTTLVILVLVVLLFCGIGFFFSDGSGGSITASTVAREALPANAVTETGYYTDADGDWIHNESELVSGLKQFYRETGVQPYVYILPNGESTSVPDLKSRAEALYPQLFTDEAHFLLVFCDDGRGGYNCGYTVGSQAKTVMDNEAVSILADYLDRYYNDSSVSEEEIFSNAFAKTAKRIMTTTKSPVVPIAVSFAAIVVIALIIFAVQKRREAKERQRQADEKMWSTPLESFGTDEAAERAKKYENTDTHK